MPEVPFPQELLSQIAEMLAGMSDGPVDLEQHRNHPDRELSHWPIIGLRVNGLEHSSVDSQQIYSTLGSQIDELRLALVRDIPDFDVNGLQMTALVNILLLRIVSEDQVDRLLRAFYRTQVQQVINRSVEIRPAGDLSTNEIESRVTAASPERWKNLGVLARNPEWIVFRYALETRAFEAYGLEPGNDGVFTLLADPEEVYLIDYSPEADEETPKMRRITPANKRMTPLKMARFFQYPGLKDLIEKDAYAKHPAAIGNNATVLAEFFCEQDEEDLWKLDRVIAADIEEWIADKLKRYNPPFELSWYLIARLSGTEFQSAVRCIEQHILDLHQEHHPWLFSLGLKTRDQCCNVGDLFELYNFALMSCKFAIDAQTRERYRDLLQVLPSICNLQTLQANPLYQGRESFTKLIAHYRDNMVDFCHLKEPVLAITDFNRDSFDPLVELFDLEYEPDHYLWNSYPGFELIDPIEVFKVDRMNQYEAGSRLIKIVVDRLKEEVIKDAKVLLRFKREVVDKLHPCKRVVFEGVFEAMALPAAAKSILAEADSDTIVDIARGEVEVDLPKRIILPGDVEWHSIVGKKFDPRRIGSAAERELLRRHLIDKKVRGGEEMATYLMSHVDTMRPSEVVRPRTDAPHDELIREYGSSPDLLALLDVATLLLYLGYDPDEVKAEIAMQAELADSMSRSELAHVGVESEMIGCTPEGTLIDQDSFSWLFNVLARDRKHTDWEDNEVMLPPTSSPWMQGILLSLMSDERFPFLDTDLLWKQTSMQGRAPNSLHLNVSIPEGLPFTPDFIDRYMNDLQRLQWLAYGGDGSQKSIAKGRVSHWRRDSLLDVMGNVDKRKKVEFRNLRMEQDGSSVRRMYQLQFLASACVQLMREQAGMKLSPSAKVMAEIYQRFQVESRTVRASDPGAAMMAEELIVKYSAEVQGELGLDFVSKREGIIFTP